MARKWEEVGGGRRVEVCAVRRSPADQALEKQRLPEAASSRSSKEELRSERESGQRSWPGSSLEKKGSGRVRCSREVQLRRNHWVWPRGASGDSSECSFGC